MANMLRLQSHNQQRQGDVSPSRRLTRILDVRDDDFAGGHIRGCINIPCWDLLSPQPAHLSTAVGTSDCSNALDKFIDMYCMRDTTERIVCHCYLSQQRGPMAARRLQERLEQLQDTGRYIDPCDVYVLKHGWRRFVRLYGNDQDLVDDV